MELTGRTLRGQRGHYRLLSVLAKGGMARVFLARPAAEGIAAPFVVVKELLPHLADKERFREMIQDEARIGALFDHPCVVKTHDLISDRAIVMEYLAGETLAFLVRNALRRSRPLPVELVVGIGVQVCAGLDHAHRLRDENGKHLHIIHRDVSPQNIIVLFSGTVKIVDFGVAQAADRIHETRTGVRKGKVAYMSPEQCLGKSLDPRSDLFSLGTLLWEVLAARRLFKRKGELESMRAIADGDVPDLAQIRPDLPPELTGLVMRALARDPADRFSSARHMATAMRNHLRRAGLPARRKDIAAFYQAVLGDQIQDRRKLLKALEASDAELEAVPALAPDKDADLPSSPEIEDPSASQELGQAERDLIERVDPDALSDEWAERSDEASDEDRHWGDIDQGDSDEEEFSDEVAEAPIHRSPLLATDDPLEEEEPEEAADEPVEYTARTQVPTAPPADAQQTLDARFAQTDDDPSPPVGDNFEEPITAIGSPGRSRAARPAKAHGKWLLPTVLIGLLLAVVAIFLAWPKGPTAGPSESPAPDPHGVPKPSFAPDSPEPGPQDVPSPTPAKLTITSKPAGCEVRLGDAALADRTPVRDFPMEPGKQVVVSVLCKGHQAERKQTSLAPGEHLELAFAPKPEPPPAPPPVRRRTGRLKLNTEPWTEVYLGDRRLGLTPLLGVRLPAGRHTLRLVNPETGLTRTLQVTIRPGRTTSLFKRFR